MRTRRRGSSPSTGRRAGRSPRRGGRCRSPWSRTERVVGTQELMAEVVRRQPERLQRLVADGVRPGPRDRRRDARGRSPPRIRRPRRARGADVGLDRQRGLAARLAAARLPARRRGADGTARRTDPAPALPPHARGVAAEPLRRHRAARSRAVPARCSGLHELAANLYNHATMATPATEISRSGAASPALSAGIAGASGYAGRELARLIAGHPRLSLRTAQARSDGFDALAPDELARCDVAFLCLPHGASQAFGEAIARAGTPVVDLGSDFRLDPGLGLRAAPSCSARTCPTRARSRIPAATRPRRRSRSHRSPRPGLLDAPVAIDGKSGVSGAGREPTERTHVSEVEGGVQPYTPTGHRAHRRDRALARAARGRATCRSRSRHTSHPTRAASR